MADMDAVPKIRLLLVDDEEEIKSIITLLLEKNYHILTADNGRDAFDIINREQLDVIVTDIVMPEASGLDLISSVKNRNIPIIAISGRGSEYLEAAASLGVAATMQKPFHISDLDKKIAQVLKQYRQA